MEMAGSGSPPPPGAAGFSEALRRCSPPLPTSLLRRLGTNQQIGIGKVKVMLRVAGVADGQQGSYLSVDARRRQVTVFDSTTPSLPEDRRIRIIAPKVFAFDAIFTPTDSQVELCSAVLSDVIYGVMNGTDGCVFSFGHAQLDKGDTMLGKYETCGVIPTAISWLYRCVTEQRQRTTTRFGIRISAVELTHRRRDLLASYANVSGEEATDRTDTLTEVRAGSMQQAAACLDAALAQRSSSDSYLLVTLHLYKHSSSGGPVGRSCLHLLDLCGGGGCDQKVARSESAGLMPSSIGNTLLAILNGQKHLPYRDQVLTHTLKECLGSLRCQAAMIAHVSQSSAHHQDTTTTIQLASRIHRLRRRRFKMVYNIVPACEETEHRLPESVDPSSSEQSADTVIYLGPGETETDGEHPPVYLHGILTPSTSTPNSPQRSISKNSSRSAKSSPGRTKPKPLLNGGEEKWIDGPKIAKSKLFEARNIVLHKDRPGQQETWVDGPNGYGYNMMDYSKRNMIRRWVENQSVQVQAQNRRKDKLKYRELTTFKKCNVDTLEQRGAASGREDSAEEESPPVPVTATETMPNEKTADISRVVPIQRLQALGEESKSPDKHHNDDIQEDEVQTELEAKEEEDSESKESSECDENFEDEDIDVNEEDDDDDDEEIIVVEEPTELVPMQDCCLQVTEEDIALCMGEVENPLPEVDQEGLDHPLRILSQENLTIMSSLSGLVDDRWQTELGQNDEDSASIVSEPLYYSTKSNEEVYCHNCKLSMANASTKRHFHLNSLNRLSKSISLLRHPDGSSNPNLSGLGLDDGWKQKNKQDPLHSLNDQDDSEDITVPPLPPLHSTVMSLSASSGFQYSTLQGRNTFLRQMNNQSRNIHDPGGRGDWYCKRLQQLRQLRSELAAHQRLERLTSNPNSWMCKFSMQESWLQRDHTS